MDGIGLPQGRGSWRAVVSAIMNLDKGKGKAVPLQAWTGPEGFLGS